jgi:two-component system, NarL family, response regulator LiaR
MEKKTVIASNTAMSTSSSIRVMLVDDHLMVRIGLMAFLRIYDDLELIGEASNGETAIRLCRQLHPDVVLMDMVMPDIDGATATRIIRQENPDIHVLVLTSFKEDRLIQSALQAGASGFLLKDIGADELAQAIRLAHSGRITLSPAAAQSLVEAVNRPASPAVNLTERERAVLVLLVDGLNNTQIAAKLVVRPSTIKTHVSNILAKLGVSSRSEAVAMAIRNQIVP